MLERQATEQKPQPKLDKQTVNMAALGHIYLHTEQPKVEYKNELL